ncbi:hypothetical protein RFI_00234, partial [Reticulomyxa filosa]
MSRSRSQTKNKKHREKKQDETAWRSKSVASSEREASGRATPESPSITPPSNTSMTITTIAIPKDKSSGKTSENKKRNSKEFVIEEQKGAEKNVNKKYTTNSNHVNFNICFYRNAKGNDSNSNEAGEGIMTREPKKQQQYRGNQLAPVGAIAAPLLFHPSTGNDLSNQSTMFRPRSASLSVYTCLYMYMY